jgi:hypothetical protein
VVSPWNWAMIAETAAVMLISLCSWNIPGSNKYQGDPVTAVSHYNIPLEDKEEIQEKMRGYKYDDVALITRDSVVGKQEYYNLRYMHFNRKGVCRNVDRSGWLKREERGLVYCSSKDTCVIVPTVCNNVSLVDKQPVIEKRGYSTEDKQFNQVPEPSTLLLVGISLWILRKRFIGS